MLGRQHEADLIHEVEKLARGAAVPRTSRSGRRRYRLKALMTALVQLGSQRHADERVLHRVGAKLLVPCDPDGNAEEGGVPVPVDQLDFLRKRVSASRHTT